MTTIATLAVRLIGDIREYTAAMNTAKTTAQQTATDISKSLKDVGGNITNAGQLMTGYLTFPLLGAGAAALHYASNLEETKNKANVVFGEMANDVMTWSLTSDTALGISQQKALDAVATFGAMGDSAGLSSEENVKWSQSLVQLGSDWSSFYNLSPVDSLNAIQSAVAGQYEPLRRMGIVINQAALEQKAMQMGLLEEGGVLSDAARYQALYALMVEKSSAAQGDFARTADGVANQARTVTAQYENAAAALGQQLLPLATQLLTWVSQGIAWFQKLNPEQQKWIMIIGGIVAVAGPVLIIVGSLITAFGAIAGVIGAISTPVLLVIGVVLLLGAAVYGLYLAWQNNWMNIQGVVQWVITYISTIVRAWQAAFNGDWHQFGQLMRQAWDMVWKVIATVVSNAWSNIKSSLSTLTVNAVNFMRSFDWASAGRNIVQGIANGILNNVSFAVNAIQRMGKAVMDAIKGFFDIKSPSGKMEREVAPWLVKGAFNFAPHMKPELFEPALARVPVLAGNRLRGLGGSQAGGGVALNAYGRVEVRVDGNGKVDMDSLLRQFRGASL